MTISPPAKVIPPELDKGKVLCSNIDTLHLAIEAEWLSSAFFKKLSKWKAYAVKTRESFPTVLYPYPPGQEWKCLIKAHGISGYEWLIDSNEFFFKIGNWTSPKEKPSILAEIRSETLWRLGPKDALKRLIHLLEGQGAEVISIKPSRVDLCLDIMLPEEFWSRELVEYMVTRAAYDACHRNRKTLTGISIGRGNFSARLYDKPLEIKQQSNKTWMYVVWEIDEVPEGKKIIRIEFQLRRQAIKELGIDNVRHLFRGLDNVWAYCTQKWLKFRTNPGKHHNLRKTFLWWETVQKGFNGVSGAKPLIRFKAVAAKESHLFNQAYGLITSREACMREAYDVDEDMRPDIGITMDIFKRQAELSNKAGFNFADEVLSKQVRYNRTDAKMLEVDKKRKRLGFPSNFTKDQLERAEAKQEKLTF